MKRIKILHLFLGVVILLFGLLKFFSPFRDWYFSQIVTSGLPLYTYTLGITVEIIAGVAFLLPFLLMMNDQLKHLLLILANCLIISIMVAATVVHLIRTVPSGVLPLKIKEPFIPLTLMAIAVFNLTRVHQLKRT